MSLKKRILEIEDTDLNKLEDVVWILDEFADLNLTRDISEIILRTLEQHHNINLRQ